eukprot:COSAG06_NODE_20851_length_779_cov_0.657353_1_plen_72_part_00
MARGTFWPMLCALRPPDAGGGGRLAADRQGGRTARGPSARHDGEGVGGGGGGAGGTKAARMAATNVKVTGA